MKCLSLSEVMIPAGEATIDMAIQNYNSIPARRFRTAVSLHDVSVKMKRQQFRYRHPDESDLQIEERLREWLHRPDPIGTPEMVIRKPRSA